MNYSSTNLIVLMLKVFAIGSASFFPSCESTYFLYLQFKVNNLKKTHVHCHFKRPVEETYVSMDLVQKQRTIKMPRLTDSQESTKSMT